MEYHAPCLHLSIFLIARTHPHTGNVFCFCPLSPVKTSWGSAQVPLFHCIKKLTHCCSVTGQENDVRRLQSCTSAFRRGVWLPSLDHFFASLGKPFGLKGRNAGDWRLCWRQHWLQQWLGVTAQALSVLNVYVALELFWHQTLAEWQ